MENIGVKMSGKGTTFFTALIGIHDDAGSIEGKYPRMRALLERVCKDLTANVDFQFDGLYARVDHVCVRMGFTGAKKYRLHTLRINANNVLHEGLVPDADTYLKDLQVLCEAIAHFYQIAVPRELSASYAALPRPDRSKRPGRKEPLLRVVVSTVDTEWIRVYDEALPDEPRKVRHGTEMNRAFNETVARIKEGMTLNLVDVGIDDQGYLVPSMIVLEPDILLDISSVAECVKEHGSHPLHFALSQYMPRPTSSAILLGNVVNLFFDEIVTSTGRRPPYDELIKKCFTSDPISFSVRDRIDKDFFDQASMQYLNIMATVDRAFMSNGGIRAEDVIVEPSFICEQLGLQGRLDFLRVGDGKEKRWIVIELKSGKAPWPEDNTSIAVNHQTQAFLYQIVLQKVLGAVFDKMDTFIFYSKYPDASLRGTKPFMDGIRKALNIRNLIVANMIDVADDGRGERSRAMIGNVTPHALVDSKYHGQNFVKQYLIPPIIEFGSSFKNAGVREAEYFHVFNSFIAREHRLSKAGDPEYGAMRSMSALWRTPWKTKVDAGDMLVDLKVVGHRNGESIELAFGGTSDGHHAFRQGDIVVLYERKEEKDSVISKRVYKGVVENVEESRISIALRGKQPGREPLPLDSTYALEHDHMDAAFVAMYRGLYALLQANKDRRDLLLAQNGRRPAIDGSLRLNIDHSARSEVLNSDLTAILRNAKQAKDFYLLKGPPGTGKTSIALKAMVEEFLTEPGANILLVAYTNRAVDEICSALTNLSDRTGFIRIGSELSCEPEYRPHLLQNKIANAKNRDLVRETIDSHRIFVGTLSSLSSRTDLFLLKHFHVAIVDEATQIVEPAMLGLLAAKDHEGRNAIDKFILIGDQRQLPAVVQQSAVKAMTGSPELNAIGITDLRCSLFERLLRAGPPHEAVGKLTKQGRMHPELAYFPNHSFYNGELEEVPTDHQRKDLGYEPPFRDVHHRLVSTKRLAFIPSSSHPDDKNDKQNTYEAMIVCRLVRSIVDLKRSENADFEPGRHIGVIASYRRQVGLIRSELMKLKIPGVDSIMVDTVERFQGAQRDIIIYSFSVAGTYQLEHLGSRIKIDDQLVDRKLNVAITRAREQLFLTGNPSILSADSTYHRLIEFIRSRSGYVDVQPDGFIDGDFDLPEALGEVDLGDEVMVLDEPFLAKFEELVIQPIKADPRTSWPLLVLGRESNHIRLNVIEFGRTVFDERSCGFSPKEKVDLYCYFNMRKHYCTSLAIYREMTDHLSSVHAGGKGNIVFIDVGCGPLTSGLAFRQALASDPDFRFDYVGIDESTSMIEKAKAFAKSGIFNGTACFRFAKGFDEIPFDYWHGKFLSPSIVVFNFSYLFGNLSNDEAIRLGEEINDLMQQFKLNKYLVVFQNSTVEKLNQSYERFKSMVPDLKVHKSSCRSVRYRNAQQSLYDSSEKVYYEILQSR